ncbi:hypothetical protein TTHERM_00209410 (macronuclear) [Tetrahymena thermophila SB210]|uniref:REJ domain protein n=1 Tax=Tetrahymena thermophila (strain SB210) TaxID=312017 RepID=Q22N98_TETTS|nr:hypothetical protein TTHERM_00209410 [Tetrahymena thermophila SB210]EAR86887.2 hypothetical protein TTHERM_00209410 [Tetrahymena thermophila SB210]|eukprot:XP_001007132.2 hypothetical protein TTHERM_00209410 [Tetrahymena thermophila SB210]
MNLISITLLASQIVLCCLSQFISEANQFQQLAQNRIIQQQQNCLDYDPLYPNVCRRCKDLLSLPDCSSCPKGYSYTGGVCIRCQPGTLDCNNLKSPYFCYSGFKVISSKFCICFPPLFGVSNWCTSSSANLYYYSYYQLGGFIVSKFSVSILTTNNQNDQTMYQFNTNNCGVLSNIASYTTIQNTMTCRVDPDQNNLFVINIQSSIVSDNMHQIIPEFSVNNLYINLNSTIQLANNITLQYTSSTQNIYFYLNQLPAPQCSFRMNQYRFQPGSVTIPMTDLIVNGFSGTTATFQLLSTTSQDATEQQSILSGLQMYPNDMTFTLNSNTFSEQNLQQTYVFTFVCNLPFGIQSTNTVTIIKVQQYDVSVSMAAPVGNYLSAYYLPTYIYTKQVLQSNYFIINQQDQFYLNAQIQDQAGQTIYTNPQITVSGTNIFPLLITPTPFLTQKTYQLAITLTYVQNSQLSFQTIIQNIVVKYNPALYAYIQGDKLLNLNPSQSLTFKSNILPSSSSQTFQNWNIFSTSSQKFIYNSDQTNSLTLPFTQNFFNVSETYIMEFDLQSNSDSSFHYYAVRLISMLDSNMQVIYLQDYDLYGLNNQDLFSFTEIYPAQNQFNRITNSHYFTITYWYKDSIGNTHMVQKNSTVQSYPQFYFTWAQYMPNNPSFVQLNFFVDDSNKNQIGLSKKYVFKTLPVPINCLNLESSAVGGEIAFSSQITFTINGCQSQYQDGVLYYQFYYYLSDKEQKQESEQTQIPKSFSRRYLSNFQTQNTITTILPPGNLYIQMYVDVMDSHKGIFTSVVRLKLANPGFTQDQYEAFILQQQTLIDNYNATQQYQAELINIGITIEAFINYEGLNPTQTPSQLIIAAKQDIKNQTLALPLELPSNIQNFNLQEFIFRCLSKLYQTLHAPDSDNLVNRVNDVYTTSRSKREKVQLLGDFQQSAKFTFIQQMFASLSILNTTLTAIYNQPPQNNITYFGDLQVNSLATAQLLISQSLNVNQQIVVWNSSYVNLTMQRVDSQYLIQNYLVNQGVTPTTTFDPNAIYDVLLQFWKSNVYALEPSYTAINQPYLSNATAAQKLELQRVFPAIEPQYYSNMNEAVQNRRRMLIVLKQANLVLPQNTGLQYNFDSVQGTGQVKCLQRISDKWSNSTCSTTKQNNTDGTFAIQCQCTSPSYTTLITDAEQLFTQNKNLQEALSTKGIISIVEKKNWYEYAAVYVIMTTNIVMAVSIFAAVKIDKISLQIGGDVLAMNFVQSVANRVQPISIEEKQKKGRSSIKDDDLRKCVINQQVLGNIQKNLQMNSDQKQEDDFDVIQLQDQIEKKPNAKQDNRINFSEQQKDQVESVLHMSEYCQKSVGTPQLDNIKQFNIENNMLALDLNKVDHEKNVSSQATHPKVDYMFQDNFSVNSILNMNSNKNSKRSKNNIINRKSKLAQFHQPYNQKLNFNSVENTPTLKGVPHNVDTQIAQSQETQLNNKHGEIIDSSPQMLISQANNNEANKESASTISHFDETSNQQRQKERSTNYMNSVSVYKGIAQYNVDHGNKYYVWI